ncbi:sensory transduction histidine kinase [Methanosarcina acetivorans C2A]|uniref:histidine kinase n=2 Tax=Methanosarcina acetivorans TaxID=2214 RepID=Q8TPF6_METAC|nr:sensory transduction histidine kinase [Methanosarcina acetivorans C2A]
MSSFTLLIIIFYFWSIGRKSANISRKGWFLIIAGFFLLFAGHLADLYESLRLVGENPVSPLHNIFLKAFLGGPVSYVLIAAGLLKWVSTVASVEKLKAEVEKRKEMQEKLSRERSMLSGLLNSIPDAVFFKDPEGTYLGCNPVFCEFVKRPTEGVVGKKNPDFYSKEVASFLNAEDKEIFETGKAIIRERWATRPDGRKVLLQTVKAPLYDETGNFIGLVGVSRDITERQRAEDALLKVRIAEDASQAKSEFIATVSHELKTPLNSIIGFSDLLLEDSSGKLSERQARYINNISISGKHLLQFIDDILDLSKIEAGKTFLEPENFEFTKIFKDIEKVFRPRVSGKKLSLNFEVDSGIKSFYADKMMFKQILYNLISNAVKFTPEEGSITVSAAKIGNMVRICVKDTGIGISREDMDSFFQPFKQPDSFFKRRYERTGLGLFLVKRFVEMHGGNIQAESVPGEGSSFIIELPLKTGNEGIMGVISGNEDKGQFISAVSSL